MQAALESSYGVQAALKAGNVAAVEKYAQIQANVKVANDFLKRERQTR